MGEYKNRLGTRRVMLYSLAFFPVLGLTLLGSLGSIEKILLFVIGFGSVIFVHELGHFITAKHFKVRCDVFSLGIGPRLCGWRKGYGFTFGSAEIGPVMPPTPASDTGNKAVASATATLTAVQPSHIGETDYRLSWLPFGGYVRMLGQDDMDPSKISDDPASFGKKPIWQRMVIISAGVIMNLIFAVAIFAAIFRVGVEFPPAVIGSLAWNSPAQKAGLQVGDRIISINHNQHRGFLEFTDLRMAAALDTRHGKMSLQYIRPGRHQIRSVDITPTTSPNNGFLAFGVGQMLSLRVPHLSKDELRQIADLSPDLKGIGSHDVIIAVNGTPVDNFLQFYDILQNCRGHRVTVTFKRPHNLGIFSLSIQPSLGMIDWVEHFPQLLGMEPRAIVGFVLADSPAKKVGIKAGDVLLRIGSTTHPTPAQAVEAVKANPSQPILIKVLRGDQTLIFKPTLSSKGLLGIGLDYDLLHPVIARVDARAQAAGILPGRSMETMRIMGTHGETFPIHTWFNLITVTRQFADHKVQLTFVSHPHPVELKISQHDVRDMDKLKYELHVPLSPLLELQKSNSIIGATMMGFDHTWGWIARTYQTLFGLVGRTVPVNQLHSVLGIVKIGYTIESRGFTYLLFFLGLISVNLAVINFLPLPIVDGGLFVLLIIEKIRGKPLPVQIQTAIQTVGIVLLVAAFLFITIHNDLPMFFGH